MRAARSHVAFRRAGKDQTTPLLHSPHKRTLETEFRFCLIDTGYAQRVFDHVLDTLYPCFCECGTKCTAVISTRAYMLRCPRCLKQKSKLSSSPFRNLRIPQWMIGWLLEESFIRHPKVVTSSEIVRKLGVSERTAIMMKRRIQIRASEQLPRVKELIKNQMQREFRDFALPPDGSDISSHRCEKESRSHGHDGLVLSVPESQ